MKKNKSKSLDNEISPPQKKTVPYKTNHKVKRYSFNI